MGIWDTEDSALDLCDIKRECEIGLSQVIMLRTTSHFGLSSSSPFSLPPFGENYPIRSLFYPLGNVKISAERSFYRPAPSVLTQQSTFYF